MFALDLDHVGVAARSLDAAQAIYTRLGFRLAPRSMHAGAVQAGGPVEPWASGNHCAMFERGYLEILGLVDASGFSTIRRHVQRYEGAHLVAFADGRDADAMHAALAAAGVDAQAPRALERNVPGEGPGAAPRRARFRNVYVNAEDFPEGRFIFIEHLTPEVLWQPQLLDHPNGALALCEIGFASDDVAASAERLGRLLGTPGVAQGGGHRFTLRRTAVQLVSRAGWRRAFPVALELPLPAPVWIGIAVRSLAATRACLAGADVESLPRADGLWVLPQHAGGVALKFVQEAA